MPLRREKYFWIEIALASAFIVVLSAVFLHYDAFEKFYFFSRLHEDWELDELIVIIISILIAGSVLAVRHIFSLNAALRKLEEAQEIIDRSIETKTQSDRLASLGQLAGGIAHEINNALQPIIGLSEVIARRLEGHDDPQLKEYMGIVSDSATHARNIVANILAFSRNQSTEFQICTTAEIIDNAVNFARHSLPPGLDITIYGAEKTNMHINGDPTSLSQVIVNLLKNASDATGGKGHVRVKVALREPDQEFLTQYELQGTVFVELRIADNGCGIPPDNLAKIFDPFFSTKDEGKGTGLGLSVSFGIIRNHGGVLLVESEPGLGTEFTILLPLADKAMHDVFLQQGGETPA